MNGLLVALRTEFGGRATATGVAPACYTICSPSRSTVWFDNGAPAFQGLWKMPLWQPVLFPRTMYKLFRQRPSADLRKIEAPCD